ncbi:PRC-barrel domain-containing protein [Marinimicrococcus flavescens]|uniref:PRC-barrel domain-containing protein n=1 Tax=Marinimicrococcus flavescens TaxID=3031815 RepID=A0AAP3XSF2_9PROT|nr:PRC-barrel domain-containing protein [Marinimicrococcus flavescens]
MTKRLLALVPLAALLGAGAVHAQQAQTPAAGPGVVPAPQSVGSGAEGPHRLWPFQGGTTAFGDDRLLVEGQVLGGFAISQLMDEDVEGADGEEIGEIEDVLVDQEGRVAAVVLEVGGFLGLGERKVALPMSQIEVRGEDRDLFTSATRDQLEELPAIARDEDGTYRVRKD